MAIENKGLKYIQVLFHEWSAATKTKHLSSLFCVIVSDFTGNSSSLQPRRLVELY